MEDKNTLHLVLKAKWYDMIASGEKKEEYREIKPYWIRRLCYTAKVESGYPELCKNISCQRCFDDCIGDWWCYPFDKVEFRYGYTKRTMLFKVEGARYGYGRPEWGAPTDKMVFIIELGRRMDD